MDKKSAKIMWWAILIIESAIFIGMLLGDFGIIATKMPTLFFGSIVYHLVAIVLIVASIINIRKLKK